MSWKGNVVDFGTSIEIIGQGQGFRGDGTIDPNDAGDGFTGIGEVHGIVRPEGIFTSIIFADTRENRHGFTAGLAGPGGPPRPSPERWACSVSSALLWGVAGSPPDVD